MERKLAAILCADVYGYSRLMGEDEEATLRTLSSHRKIIDRLIEQHHGRFVNSAGDSVLAEFASVVNAIQCAVDVQSALKVENATLAPERRMEFRIGVNLGDVMVEGEQIYGDGVNVAARLESLAEPGGICLSGTVHDHVSSKLALSYADLGEQAVKNIAKPVRVFRVLPEGTVAPRGTRRIPRSYWRGGVLSLSGLAIILATIVLVQHVSLKPPHTNASIPLQEKPALPLPSIPSIAVLPFTNESDPNQEYFSDGITEQVINELSRLPGLFVIARNSSFSYRGKATSEHEIGKELGVKYILEGSVQKAADRLRIGVELVDASAGSEMWTENYDRPLKDIFAVQDEIVSKLVTTLGLIMKLQEMKAAHSGPWLRTNNLDAFDDLLRASAYEERFTRDDNLTGREWAEKAIERDPRFAGGYSALGYLYFESVLFQWSQNPEADLKQSRELAQKALALDDSNVYALGLLCEIDWKQKRYEKAIAEGERAVALNPNYSNGYLALSQALSVADRPQAAVEAAEQATRLDPAGKDFYAYFIAASYVLMGRYHEAIPLLKRHIATYPGQPWAHATLIVAYTELGRDADARAEAAEFKRSNPGFVVSDVNENAAVNQRWGSDLRKAGMQ